MKIESFERTLISGGEQVLEEVRILCDGVQHVFARTRGTKDWWAIHGNIEVLNHALKELAERPLIKLAKKAKREWKISKADYETAKALREEVEGVSPFLKEEVDAFKRIHLIFTNSNKKEEK